MKGGQKMQQSKFIIEDLDCCILYNYIIVTLYNYILFPTLIFGLLTSCDALPMVGLFKKKISIFVFKVIAL